jgi:hypothetical protein
LPYKLSSTLAWLCYKIRTNFVSAERHSSVVMNDAPESFYALAARSAVKAHDAAARCLRQVSSIS